MFHQVRVTDRDADSLRFPWKDREDQGPSIYQMLVHICGAKDSPCCSSSALQRIADDHIDTLSSEALRAIKGDFYVDDLLKSVRTVKEGKSLCYELTDVLQKRGFRLTSWGVLIHDFDKVADFEIIATSCPL